MTLIQEKLYFAIYHFIDELHFAETLPSAMFLSTSSSRGGTASRLSNLIFFLHSEKSASRLLSLLDK